MSEAKTSPEPQTDTPVTPQEASFAGTISIHYITMALYTLGFVGTAGNLLLGLVQGETENLLAYAILTLLPVILFLTHLMVVRGLNKRQQWGYKASRWLGFLLLLLFPFGTVLGLFMLSQLSKFRISDQSIIAP